MRARSDVPIGGRAVLASDSLAAAFLGAARVTAGVRDGHTLRAGLDRERQTAPATRGGAAGMKGGDPLGAIHDLAAHTLRRRSRADLLLAEIAGRLPEPPLLRELLVVSIALLVDALQPAEDAFEARVARLPYAPFTLVDQAVQATRSDPDLARGKGFVNAVLRTLLRRMEEDPRALQQRIEAVPAARFELPSWWLQRLQAAYPDDWRQIACVSLERPPLVVRVNRRRSSRDAYLADLARVGVAGSPVGRDGVRFDRPTPVAAIPGFADGVVSIQDEAAQRAAPLLDAADGMRVLDACAAPGGKTGHLLECADLDLTALDSDPQRLARVRDNLQRLDRSAHCVVGDASDPGAWWDGRPYDRILADVPCTASGILRRHPDIRWLRRETDIAQLSRRAQQMTAALWSLLNPGGRFLLVTCSVFPEESVRHAEQFAAVHPDARALDAPGQLLPTHAEGAPASALHDHDGLFFALFEKTR